MSFSQYVVSTKNVIFSALKSTDPIQQQLHQENITLKRALKERVPGSNPRAEAAERSLFELRRTIVSLAIKTFLPNSGSRLRIGLLLKGIGELWES